MRTLSVCTILVVSLIVGGASGATLIDLDFNSGVDALGNSQGDLIFNGIDGFQMTLTDDDSNGGRGGDADGVHISNKHYANAKVGSSDLVVGAYNDWIGADNYHSSGIVAKFNKGVDLVRLFDTDNDATTKTLYAFDQAGTLIGQTAAGSKITFTISVADTDNVPIWSVEFDTLPGSLGGSLDGTYFTMDDFYVEGPVAPEPATLSLLALGGVALVRRKRK